MEMPRCKALYSHSLPASYPRASLEVSLECVVVTSPGCNVRRVQLAGAEFSIGDATCDRRFVRHLELHQATSRIDLITPPEEGAIAPRAARLPDVPPDRAIVGALEWSAAVRWLRDGGRLTGKTIAELAALARVATPQFAIVIGEYAADRALEIVAGRSGPMRGGVGLRQSLRPLEVCARTSARAADALVAALSRVMGLRL